MGVLRAVLRGIVAVFLLVEEVFWILVGPIRAWLSGLRVAERLRRLPPYPALFALILPGLPGGVLNVVKYWALAQGRLGLALTCFLLAKFVGLTLFSFVWKQVSPAVLTIAWVRAIHDPIRDILASAHAWLNRQPWVIAVRTAFRRWKDQARALMQRVRGALGGWLRRRHDARAGE